MGLKRLDWKACSSSKGFSPIVSLWLGLGGGEGGQLILVVCTFGQETTLGLTFTPSEVLEENKAFLFDSPSDQSAENLLPALEVDGPLVAVGAEATRGSRISLPSEDFTPTFICGGTDSSAIAGFWIF